MGESRNESSNAGGNTDLNNNLLPCSEPPTEKDSNDLKSWTQLKLNKDEKSHVKEKKQDISESFIKCKTWTMSVPLLCSFVWISLSLLNCQVYCTKMDEIGSVSKDPSALFLPEDELQLQSFLDDLPEPKLRTRRVQRTGRVLTSPSGPSSTIIANSSKENILSFQPTTTGGGPLSLNSSSSEENGSSRKAAPDVQDIIDGIVKLLGGKVHPSQVQQRPSIFNQPKFPIPIQNQNPNLNGLGLDQNGKPSRINNRGPVLPGDQNSAGSGSSFEAIPLEAINSDFKNLGPPFPISGNGGGVIAPNVGGHDKGKIEPPFKQGVPIPELVVPQNQGQYQQGQGQGGPQFFQNFPQNPSLVPNQNPYQVPSPNQNFIQNQNQQRPLSSPLPAHGHYNNYGFENPRPFQNSQKPNPFNVPNGNGNGNVPNPNSNANPNYNYMHPSKKPGKSPVIKFPTEAPSKPTSSTADDVEDDEADELRFTTPKGPPAIHPTSSSSLQEGVYPTLLLSTNRDNGLVELVTEVRDATKGIKPTASVSSATVSSSRSPATTEKSSTTTTSSSTTTGNPPIFYPNGNSNLNRGKVEISTTTPTPVSTVGTGSTNPMSIHSLPTPPLRPGFVLPDPQRPVSTRPTSGIGSVEVVTAEEGQALLAGQGQGQVGDIFDVTVTAKQSYGGKTGQPDFILTSPQGTDQFVSIDGKRTYFNLHPNSATATQIGISPTPVKELEGVSATVVPTTTTTTNTPKNIGIGSVGAPVPLLPQSPGKTLFNSNTPLKASAVSTSLSITGGSDSKGKSPPNIIRRPATRRPSVPPIRIDTCIVGDDSTCNQEQFEVCKTESGVSSCVCRSGYARRRHREPCRPVWSIQLSLKLDKLGDKKLTYNKDYFNPNSELYQTIEWEAIHALDASLSETTLSHSYIGSKLDAIGFDGKHVVVNSTLLLQEGKGSPTALKKDIQNQMIQVLTRHRNNFGKSQLWVEGPISAVAHVGDINECANDELNDCHDKATCTNTFGSFECKCEKGYGDPFEGDKRRAGKHCETCSGKQYCNGRGECLVESGNRVCRCNGNYYGSQCDIDGEVLAVAIGASVSAVVIIGLTLACLCMWSRKWKREEQKAALMSRSMFGGALSYIGGGKTNPYQQHVGIDERLRWAQAVDQANMNMTGNIYVQNDPLSLAQCGMSGGPPMMELRRSAETVDTVVDDMFEEQRPSKRPRSRASQFQGAGSIYYDLEPEQMNMQTDIYASRSMLHFPPPPAQFCVPHFPPGGRSYYS